MRIKRRGKEREREKETARSWGGGGGRLSQGWRAATSNSLSPQKERLTMSLMLTRNRLSLMKLSMQI